MELQPIPLSPNLSRLDLEIFHCDNFKQWEKFFTEMENLYCQFHQEKVPPISWIKILPPQFGWPSWHGSKKFTDALQFRFAFSTVYLVLGGPKTTAFLSR